MSKVRGTKKPKKTKRIGKIVKELPGELSKAARAAAINEYTEYKNLGNEIKREIQQVPTNAKNYITRKKTEAATAAKAAKAAAIAAATATSSAASSAATATSSAASSAATAVKTAPGKILEQALIKGPGVLQFATKNTTAAKEYLQNTGSQAFKALPGLSSSALNAINNLFPSGILSYKAIAGLFGVVVIILSAIVGKGVITITTAVSIFLFFSSIIVSGVIAIIIYKRTDGNLSRQINQLKEESNKNIEELLKSQSTNDVSKAKQENETNIDTIFQQVSSSNESVLMTIMNTLGDFINNIVGWLTPSSTSTDSIPMKKSVTINGITYTSLINPTSNSIDNLLLNIIPTNYGIMDSLNDVDDMFARIKVGKELPKENTYSFKKTFEFEKQERDRPDIQPAGTSSASAASGTSGTSVTPVTPAISAAPVVGKGGRPKNTRNKKKGRRSRKSKTQKMKRKKYI